jgi:hypothetical protein
VFALEWEMVQQLVQNCGGAVGKLGAGVTYEIFIKSS